VKLAHVETPVAQPDVAGLRAPAPAADPTILLPVSRPKLPSADEILPYLRCIDDARWYSNLGPLATRLEEQLSHHFGLSDRGVVATANATAGLTAALLARGVSAGSICVMPSWTFVASPHAARCAGMKPWFHDVDRQTWALNPDKVQETLNRIPAPVGAVMVVSPFGAPLDMEAWQAFEDRTGVPVVIDAAAGFDTARAFSIPTVVSLHATKILGAGEGGFILTGDRQLRDRAVGCSNFGFRGSRSALVPALNAKMSEYHAAVALAGLTCWPAIRSQHAGIAEWYSQAIARLEGVSLQPGYGTGWVSGTTNVVLPPGVMARVSRHLRERGIDTRSWWGNGCHVQPAFEGYPRNPLPLTEDLGTRVLGLPHFPDMQGTDVARVVEALSEALGQARS